MCGIICICSSGQNNPDLFTHFEIFKENISKRGPDYLDVKLYCSEKCDLLFAASVLWLQGRNITKQPLEDDECVLIYNGDIFGGLPTELIREEGDTKILFRLMHNTNKLSTILSQLQGPYAFIYFDKMEEKLYFGRDIYGRRSLLIGKHNEVIILTSVSKRTKGYDFVELPCIGIFYLDLKTNHLGVLPWTYLNPNFNKKLSELKHFIKKEIFIAQELENFEYLKFKEPSVEELCLYKDIKEIGTGSHFDILNNNTEWSHKILILNKLLENSVEKRISTQPNYCRSCIKEATNCHHSLTGILFSGGIDCAILALLTDKFTESGRPIDLINVAFDESNNYKTPDRITGLQTLKELKLLRPKREWNFIEVNVPREELNSERSQHIADLIYPLQTILDDSLGCALWFASRGKQGTVLSPCRVLLVGMGADELFGGYTRHRAAFKKNGWFGLHNVLIEDWQNLPYRNLARDDRVVSDHGRQLRTPYLDENFVQFVCNLNCWEKTYPSDEVPRGIGEKILLRSLGYFLGLKNACMLQKRALQFGSRIANKKENAHDLSIRLCN